jgi:hypothetical protein
MNRSSAADKITEAFLACLREHGASARMMAEVATDFPDQPLHDLLLGLGRAGRKVFLVSGVGLVNVHVRASATGFWGVEKTVKRDFDAVARHLEVPGHFVFLVGRDDKHVADGYIASTLDSPPFIRPVRAHDTSYKINERQDLDPSKKLLGVRRVAEALSQRRWETKP